MKKCPQCSREYDVTMSFCLDDGTELLYGPGSSELDAQDTTASTSSQLRTRLMRELDEPADSKRQTIRGTDPTVVLPRPARVKRNSLLILAGSVAAVCVVLAAAFACYRLLLSSSAKAPHFEKISLSRLTNDGNIDLAAISPDGKYIAYLSVEGTVNAFWTLHLATNSRVKIATPTNVIPFIAPAFSPDGNYVYFSAENEAERSVADIYKVAVLGGPARKVLSNVQSGLSFSPDASRVAFSRFDNVRNTTSILTAAVDGTDERTLVSRDLPAFVGARGVAWSPRGDLLAFDIGNGIGDENGGIGVVNAQGGDVTMVTKAPLNFVGNLQWLKDQSGLVCPAKLKSAEPIRVWEVSYPSGAVTRVTDELSNFDPSSIAITGDGRSILAVSTQAHRKIAVGSASDPAIAQVMSAGNVSKGAAWDSTGKLYYASIKEERSQIWQVDAAGGDAKPIADLPVLDDLNVTPDGRYFIFLAETSGTWQLWKANANGGDLKKLTDTPNIWSGSSISPDGKWIFFATVGGAIWKIPVDGGEATKISLGAADNPACPRLSPDGKMLAYTAGFNGALVVDTFDGQNATQIKRFDLPVNFYGMYRWAPDNKSLVYVNTNGGVSDLWRQQIDGTPAKKITDFKSESISSFDFSTDGKRIAITRGPVTNDAVLITDAAAGS